MGKLIFGKKDLIMNSILSLFTLLRVAIAFMMAVIGLTELMTGNLLAALGYAIIVSVILIGWESDATPAKRGFMIATGLVLLPLSFYAGNLSFFIFAAMSLYFSGAVMWGWRYLTQKSFRVKVVEDSKQMQAEHKNLEREEELAREMYKYLSKKKD